MSVTVPLYTPIESRDGALTKGAFCKNVVVEKVGDAFNTFRRPGLSTYASLSTSAVGQGITNFFAPGGDEYLIQVAGSKAYSVAGIDYGLPLVRTADGQVRSSSGFEVYGSQDVVDNYVMVSYKGYVWLIGGDRMPSSGGTHRFCVFYSADKGTTWTKLVDVADGTAGYPGAGGWTGCVHNGKIFLVGGRLPSGAVRQEAWSTTDGVTWTQVNAATGFPGAGTVAQVVSHGASMYAIFVNVANLVWSSTDGVTWTQTEAVSGLNGCIAPWVVSDGTYLYAFTGPNTTGGKKIYRTTNGASWTEFGTDALTMLSSQNNNSVNVVRSGGLWILFEWVDFGSIVGTVWRSSDLTTWTQIVTGLSGSANLRVATGGFPYRTGPMVATSAGILFMGNLDTGGFGTTGNQRVYKLPLNPSTGTSIEIASVGAGYADFAQNYNRTMVAIKTADGLWQMTIPEFTTTKVTDADYPSATVRGLVYLNGVFYVMDAQGNIYGSDNEDITAWDPLNVIGAAFEGDGGVALAKYQFYVVAFGEYTTEFFFDAGNPTGSPLSPVQNGVINIGCADADSVVFADDTVIFVGRARGPSQSVTGAKFIAQLNGTQTSRISTPDIDRIINADDFASVEAVAFSVAGHTYYALNLGTSAITLVYDLTQQVWTVWDSRRRTSFTNVMSGVVSGSGTATWTGTHSYADGDVAVITAFTGTDTSLNGTYNVIAPNTNTLSWRLSGTTFSGTSTTTGTATGRAAGSFGVVGACGFKGAQLMQDGPTGALYTLAPTVYQDAGAYVDWEVRPAKLDSGDNKAKYVGYADFVSDRVAGNVLMRHSDNDGVSWTKFRPRSLALNRTRFQRGGLFTRRMYDWRITDNVPVRAQRVEYMVDQGAE